MRTFYRPIVHWLAGEEGQDLIEYGLLAFLIAAALVVVLSLVAPPLLTVFSDIVSAFP
jgi:Flp pilus assembly pilin Flp